MSDFKSLLPPYATSAERQVEQPLAEKYPTLQPPIGDFWSAGSCPTEILGWLAWSLSVDNWDSDWSEDAKREVIAQSPFVHRHKGTLGAVKRALKAAGYGDAEVVEKYGWEKHDAQVAHDGSVSYAPPDHWAEYRVKLVRPITVEQAAQVREILDSVAPVRCRLKALDFTEALNTYAARIKHDGQFTHGVA